MEFKWQALYDRKCHCCSTLIWPQEAKWKFRILPEYVQDMTNHILEYQLSTPENVDVVQVTNFTKKKKRRFSTLIWSLRIKWKFRNLIAHPRHSQSYPRVSFVYSMTFLWQPNQNVILGGKNENSKTLLRICKTCPIRSLNNWLRLRMWT